MDYTKKLILKILRNRAFCQRTAVQPPTMLALFRGFPHQKYSSSVNVKKIKNQIQI